MSKFKLKDHVRKIGSDKIFTVEGIRDEEPKYQIQSGSDFASRQWAKECELELADVKTPSGG